MRLRRKIPAAVGVALIVCGLLIVYVHLQWPERFDRVVGPFLPWRVETGMKLPTVVLTIGVLLLLVASTGSRDQD
jgi:uncharacterized membrane protein